MQWYASDVKKANVYCTRKMNVKKSEIQIFKKI